MSVTRGFRLFWVILLLIIAVPIFSAQNVFVLGSFKSPDAAYAEASRISQELKLELHIEEILIDGISFHRLLLPYSMDPLLETELPQKLIYLGVKDVWRSRADLSEVAKVSQSTAPNMHEFRSGSEGSWKAHSSVVYQNQLYQVIAGSFRLQSRAEEFAEDLSLWMEETNVVATDIVGKIVYRVAVGPFVQSDAFSAKRQLEDLGVISPWLISYDKEAPVSEDVSLDQKVLDSLEFDPAFRKRAEEKIQAIDTKKSISSEFADTEYNLAELKKK